MFQPPPSVPVTSNLELHIDVFGSVWIRDTYHNAIRIPYSKIVLLSDALRKSKQLIDDNNATDCNNWVVR